MNIKIILIADILIFFSFFFLAGFIKIKIKLKTNLLRTLIYAIELMKFLLLLPFHLIRISSNKKYIKKMKLKDNRINKTNFMYLMFKTTYFNLQDLIDFIITDFEKFESKRMMTILVKKYDEKYHYLNYEKIGSVKIKNYYDQLGEGNPLYQHFKKTSKETTV